ncbi:MAG: DsbA family protein [Pseudomonadota bacterium]
MVHKTESSAEKFRFRRAFLCGLAAGSVLAVTIAGLTPAFAQHNARDVDVEKLMAKGPLDDLIIGNPDAKVTVIEYASMTCGHCANFHNNVYPELKKKYIDTGKIRFIFREYPLDNLAAAASMLGRCTGSSEKALQLANVLLKRQREWVSREPVKKLYDIVKQAGFTQEKFNACLRDQELLGKIAKQREIASRDFGVAATPTFFINGKRLNGRSDQISTFEAVIDPLLKDSAS